MRSLFARCGSNSKRLMIRLKIIFHLLSGKLIILREIIIIIEGYDPENTKYSTYVLKNGAD